MFDALDSPNLSRLWSNLIIKTLVDKNITNFFTSPGLRNAPLLSAIQKQSKATAFSGMDERGMAYRALGYGKATGLPGVLVCTSGTAMANYLPAVIEAYQTNIPLIILSADRPKKLVEWGDNQSIHQPGLFGKYLRNELNLELPSFDSEPQYLVDQISRLLDKNEILGPLHINIPFNEPLDLREENIPVDLREKARKTTVASFLHESSSRVVLPTLSKDAKTLVVLGPTPEYADKTSLIELINSVQLPCLLDVGSGLKFSSIESSRILPSFEHPEIRKMLEADKPELIVHLGGRLVSKHYYSFLRDNPEIDVLLVGNSGHYTHPASSPRWQVNSDLTEFCQKALKTNFLGELKPYMFDCAHIVGAKEDLIENSSFSFPAISKKLIEIIPTDSTLYLGNSTTIRSFDAYASTKTQGKKIDVITHRGASGIEGFNAAALGYAEHTEKPTFLVHGDVGFLHDLNSVILYKDKKIPLINIIINNNGGGIFKHLPISKDKETMPLITTEHNLEIEGAINWLGLKYFRAENIGQFENSIKQAIHSQSVVFIEAVIDQNDNEAVYERLKTLKL